ncbi:MAG: sensor histidine kinase, partial [Anaerolineae bacterium]
RRAQAQMLEQQWALATLQEREQLARELHDSIGQVLGYAGLQTDTASALVEQGRSSEARVLLERLAAVLRDAHADVRKQIMDLRATPSPQEPFLDVVRHYVNGFAANYGIAASLQIGDGLDDASLPPEVQVQLYRILQEALANVRKHSGAQRVQVTIARTEGTLRMAVVDDGHGFVPEQVDGGGAGHLGIGYMRARAEQLGGSLTVTSAAESGTTLTVTVPEGGRSDARPAG